MALSADDVHNIAFRKAPLGRRGYDEQEVDAFLNLVETTLTELRAELARAGGGQAAVLDSGMPDSAVLSELDQIKQRLSRIEAALGSARSTSDNTAF